MAIAVVYRSKTLFGWSSSNIYIHLITSTVRLPSTFLGVVVSFVEERETTYIERIQEISFTVKEISCNSKVQPHRHSPPPLSSTVKRSDSKERDGIRTAEDRCQRGGTPSSATIDYDHTIIDYSVRSKYYGVRTTRSSFERTPTKNGFTLVPSFSTHDLPFCHCNGTFWNIQIYRWRDLNTLPLL